MPAMLPPSILTFLAQRGLISGNNVTPQEEPEPVPSYRNPFLPSVSDITALNPVGPFGFGVAPEPGLPSGPPVDPRATFAGIQQGGSSTASRPFDGVRGGGSSTAPPANFSGAKNAPPQEEESPSWLRYSLAGATGPREEGRAFGQRYTKPMAPDPSTFQDYKPGQGSGTVSMMTAPENVEEVTFASRMDDLQRKAAENELRQLAADPFYLERQKQEQEIAKATEIARAQADARLRPFERVEDSVFDAMAKEIMAGPETEAEKQAALNELLKQRRQQVQDPFGRNAY